MVGAAPLAYDVPSLFDAVQSQKGVIYGNTIREFYRNYEGSTTHGSFASNDAQIELGIIRVNSTNDPKIAENYIGMEAISSIHELMHLASGRYHDFILADAVMEITGDPQQVFSDVYYASIYWNAELERRCTR